METTVEFSELIKNPKFLEILTTNGFTHASPVQEKTFVDIVNGQDIFAQAKTGSGKTGAFSFPVMNILLEENEAHPELQKECRFLIVTPTRELAQQIRAFFETFYDALKINTVCIIGGENIQKQKDQLEKGAQVIIGTPGRIIDLIKQKNINLTHLKGIIFDEADRLFDMGFKKEIESILRFAPKNKQLVMVSATYSQDVLEMAYRFHSSPKEYRLSEEDITVDRIDQKLAMLDQNEKFPYLVNLLRKEENSYAMVFCNTQHQTHFVAEWLRKMGFKAKPISGRLAQNARSRLMKDFREREITILVCTDVAARGLDVDDIELVINYDLPSEAANYVHRIGRTGRAGKNGKSISFCAFEDCDFLEPIYDLIGQKIEKVDLTEDDFATDIAKKPRLDTKSLKLIGDKDKMKTTNKKDSKKRDTKRDSKKKEPRTREEKGEFKMPAHLVYKVTSFSEKEALTKAMKYFNVGRDNLLEMKVVGEGRRKFFIFGAKEKSYEVTVKPFYNKLIYPFVVGIFKKANLNVKVTVQYQRPIISINVNGADVPMLKKYENEWRRSLETILKEFLRRKVPVNNYLKIHTHFHSEKAMKSREKDMEGDLIKLAKKLKKDALSKNTPLETKTLSAKERRIIHVFFENDKEISTESVGDGRYKKMKIIPVVN